MNEREIKHHFDVIDEMEEKENLQSAQSDHTVTNYFKIRTFKLRFGGRVILKIPPFTLVAFLLWIICYLFPVADTLLITAKYFALSLAIIEMVLYLVSGQYRDDDDD